MLILKLNYFRVTNAESSCDIDIVGKNIKTVNEIFNKVEKGTCEIDLD